MSPYRIWGGDWIDCYLEDESENFLDDHFGTHWLACLPTIYIVVSGQAEMVADEPR